LGRLSAANKQAVSRMTGIDADSCPLISKINADKGCKARYDKYLLKVISEAFETNSI
jgi:hypothetical protein